MEEKKLAKMFFTENNTKLFTCSLLDMSHELLCHILQYLPLHEVLSLSMLCRKLFTAVGMYLRLCKSIDFCEGKMYGYMPSSVTDDHIHALFRKCPHVEYVYGLHPQKVERRRLRRRSALTVPGIIEALSLCGNLKAVEISDLRLLEALMQHLPDLEIIGNFQNRDGVFPPHASHRLKLQPYPRIFSLHLVGVEVPELTAMPHLQHLHLQCVRFTKLQPFRGFLAQNLKSFVMKHCMGPSMSLRYLSLIIALSSAPSLTRLELVRVPLPGGLFQRAIEDSYRHNGFVNLKHLVISGCKGVLESDLGHLMIVSSKNLESISIQPSLTRDSLFVSLSFAQCSFPELKSLHLGFIDKLSISGEWSNDTLLTLGLAEIPDTPSSLTDSGMKIIVELFQKMKSLSVSNCPHLMAMDQWYNSLGDPALQELTDLTLQHCHCIQLPSFALFLAFLPKVEVVILNDMFREPPKGCSHVGLSAGTGLGMSSAVVSNQDEHVAVNGNQQDFEAQGEDNIENDEMDLDLDEIERYQEPHRMVLPQEFFDDQNNAVAPIERGEQDMSIDSDEPFEQIIDQNRELPCSGTESEDDIKDQPLEVDPSDNYPNTRGQHKSDNENSLNSFDESDSDNAPVAGIKKGTFKVQKSKRRSWRKGKKPSKRRQLQHSCVSSFDPTQPSTSKSGNCICACDSSDPEINIGECAHGRVPNTSNGKDCLSKAKRSVGCTEKCGSSSSPSCAIKVMRIKNEHDYSKKTCKDLRGEDFQSESEGSDPEGRDGDKNRSKDKSAVDRLDCLIKSPNHEGQNSRKVHSLSKDSPMKKSHSKGSTFQNNCSFSNDFQDEKNNGFKNAQQIPAAHGAPKFRNKNGNECSKMLNTNRKCSKSSKQSSKKSVPESYNFVSEGTQATSADIRRSHKKQKASPPKRRSQRRANVQNESPSNSISAREEHKKSKRKPDFGIQNKATSTSDPLMEDDAVQILRLVSESLISLSVISCGVSDIIVDHCHNLTHLEVQACRILKRLQLLHSPNLQRLNIGQCPKLEIDTLVLQVLCNLSYVNILVTFEPCVKAYYPQVSEKIIFQRAAANQSVILIHDYSGEANENIQAVFKENIIAWMGIVQKMRNSTLPMKLESKKKKKKWEPKLKYPWGHNLRRIHGVIPSSNEAVEKCKYQILTNDRLFAAAIEVMPWERGIPPPCRTLEWEAENQFLSSVTNQLFTSKFLKRLIAFYIPVTEDN